MERINIRLLCTPDLAAAIPAFHGWIQQGISVELLIDVVDYRHVPDGPGVVLIGHEADYSLNETGLTYSRKAKHPGSPAGKISDAYNRASAAAERLGLSWKGFEVIVNDRIGTPNTDENWEALRAAISETFGGEFDISRPGEPRSRLTARVTSKTALAASLRRQTAAAH